MRVWGLMGSVRVWVLGLASSVVDGAVILFRLEWVCAGFLRARVPYLGFIKCQKLIFWLLEFATGFLTGLGNLKIQVLELSRAFVQ